MHWTSVRYISEMFIKKLYLFIYIFFIPNRLFYKCHEQIQYEV